MKENTVFKPALFHMKIDLVPGRGVLLMKVSFILTQNVLLHRIVLSLRYRSENILKLLFDVANHLKLKHYPQEQKKNRLDLSINSLSTKIMMIWDISISFG